MNRANQNIVLNSGLRVSKAKRVEVLPLYVSLAFLQQIQREARKINRFEREFKEKLSSAKPQDLPGDLIRAYSEQLPRWAKSETAPSVKATKEISRALMEFGWLIVQNFDPWLTIDDFCIQRGESQLPFCTELLQIPGKQGADSELIISDFVVIGAGRCIQSSGNGLRRGWGGVFLSEALFAARVAGLVNSVVENWGHEPAWLSFINGVQMEHAWDIGKCSPAPASSAKLAQFGRYKNYLRQCHKVCGYVSSGALNAKDDRRERRRVVSAADGALGCLLGFGLVSNSKFLDLIDSSGRMIDPSEMVKCVKHAVYPHQIILEGAKRSQLSKIEIGTELLSEELALIENEVAEGSITACCPLAERAGYLEYLSWPKDMLASNCDLFTKHFLISYLAKEGCYSLHPSDLAKAVARVGARVNSLKYDEPLKLSKSNRPILISRIDSERPVVAVLDPNTELSQVIVQELSRLKSGRRTKLSNLLELYNSQLAPKVASLEQSLNLDDRGGNNFRSNHERIAKFLTVARFCNPFLTSDWLKIRQSRRDVRLVFNSRSPIAEICRNYRCCKIQLAVFTEGKLRRKIIRVSRLSRFQISISRAELPDECIIEALIFEIAGEEFTGPIRPAFISLMRG